MIHLLIGNVVVNPGDTSTHQIYYWIRNYVVYRHVYFQNNTFKNNNAIAICEMLRMYRDVLVGNKANTLGDHIFGRFYLVPSKCLLNALC